VAVVVGLSFLCAGRASAQAADIAAIRALQDEQAAAWNRHDAAAYATLFTEDGEVVNVQGWWWKGREEIEQKLAQAFAFVFAESRLSIVDVHVKLLEPNCALAHVIWKMDGAKAPPGGAPPRDGIQLQVLRKNEDGWRIVSFQNTNSIPETPFPSAPPLNPR
jgi:uncharacterized protein (TIGR02246 family)